MRGHGRAEGQRGHVDGYRDYLRDLDAAHAQLMTHGGSSLPILLVTHSNGGLIAMRHLADPTRHLDNVDSAILSSPFLGLKANVPLWKDALGRAAGRFAPRLSMPNELRIEDLTHDPDKLAERRVDTLCHEVASARWFTSALHSHEYVRELAHRVTLPTLWLVAEDDRIADPAAARTVHGRLRAPSRLHTLPGMFHEVFNEVDRGRVFELVRAWINERFSS
jgi:alpha-beta hydrolase superfamily lysophospholipase